MGLKNFIKKNSKIVAISLPLIVLTIYYLVTFAFTSKWSATYYIVENTLYFVAFLSALILLIEFLKPKSNKTFLSLIFFGFFLFFVIWVSKVFFVIQNAFQFKSTMFMIVAPFALLYIVLSYFIFKGIFKDQFNTQMPFMKVMMYLVCILFGILLGITLFSPIIISIFGLLITAPFFIAGLLLLIAKFGLPFPLEKREKVKAEIASNQNNVEKDEKNNEEKVDKETDNKEGDSKDTDEVKKSEEAKN